MITPEIRFGEDIPTKTFAECKGNKYMDHTCGECVRCKERNPKMGSGFHCTSQNYDIDIAPQRQACKDFWSKSEQEQLDKQHETAIETERKRLWKIYAGKPFVHLPIEFDGYGNIPVCPICGEMPYSTEQCHWCGQHFVQDEKIAEYNKPAPVERMTCPNCGGKNTMVGTHSNYNGHFHGSCEKCGCVVMQ